MTRWRCAFGQVTDPREQAIAAGTDSMIEQNAAGVLPTERRLGAIDDGSSVDRVGCGEDHRAEDPLQQVLGDHRLAGQWECLLQQTHRRVAVAFGDAYFGEALQRVRLTGRRSEVAVQLAGLGQLGRGEPEVAREQRGFADQRRRERRRTQRPLRRAVVCRSRATAMTSA